jgi:hypothetical protein
VLRGFISTYLSVEFSLYTHILHAWILLILQALANTSLPFLKWSFLFSTLPHYSLFQYLPISSEHIPKMAIILFVGLLIMDGFSVKYKKT